MNRPRVALFDLGNVLVRVEGARFFDTLGIADHSEQERIGTEMAAAGRNMEMGTSSPEEFRAVLRRTVRAQYSPAKLNAAFAAMITGPVTGMEEMVRHVAAVCRTAVVSNTSPPHFARSLEIAPVLRHMRRFYLSYELRAMKPDRAFFDAVIAGEACDPDDMVFIDDMPENVEAAARAGLRAIRFEGPGSLSQALGLPWR